MSVVSIGVFFVGCYCKSVFPCVCRHTAIFICSSDFHNDH